MQGEHGWFPVDAPKEKASSAVWGFLKFLAHT
jgi:hypothetical protein